MLNTIILFSTCYCILFFFISFYKFIIFALLLLSECNVEFIRDKWRDVFFLRGGMLIGRELGGCWECDSVIWDSSQV